MGINKSKHITFSNLDEWLSALGFSFPRNHAEEKIFDKLYAGFEHQLNETEIDPLKLLNELRNENCENNIHIEHNWKMAARNLEENGIPKHILEKMKKNQDDKSKNDNKD